MQENNTDIRLNEIIEAITAIASLDFSKKLEVTEEQDLLDVVSLGFNMLSEALEGTVVSKEVLEESQKKYKMLFSKANDVILLVKNGKINDFNEKTLEVFGYEVEELKGKFIKDLVLECQDNGMNSLDLLKEMTREALEKGSCLRNFKNKKKDQSLFDAEMSISTLILDGETYFQAIIRDISAQKQAEEALKKSVAQFKGLFDHAPNAMLISRGKELLRCNSAFEEMFGYTLKELGTFNWMNLTYIDDRELDLSLKKKLLAGDIQKFSLEKRYVKKNGEILNGNVNVSLVKGKNAAEDYLIIQITDVTKEKKAEQQIHAHLEEVERINKELDQFAHIVSHDLKAPLRAISTLASFIEEDIADENYEDIKDNLGLLKSRVSRMGNLITGILEFSRAGKYIEEQEFICVNKLLKEVVELINIPSTTQIVIAPTMPKLYSVKISIQQVFQNLITNAIKYNDKKSCIIHIDCLEEKECYKFTIRDNGPGISKVYHDKIFEIFQTLQSRDRIESTGVGLSIVKKRLENLGGKVWVESEEGKGAAFIFTLKKYTSFHKV